MAVYAYRCKECGAQQELSGPIGQPTPAPTCHGSMGRDYRAEASQPLVVGLKLEREANGTRGYQDLFLPGNKDFAGPGDPEGKKGMREWRDKHEPKPGNKRPAWPGEIERKVF